MKYDGSQTGAERNLTAQIKELLGDQYDPKASYSVGPIRDPSKANYQPLGVLANGQQLWLKGATDVV